MDKNIVMEYLWKMNDFIIYDCITIILLSLWFLSNDLYHENGSPLNNMKTVIWMIVEMHTAMRLMDVILPTFMASNVVQKKTCEPT